MYRPISAKIGAIIGAVIATIGVADKPIAADRPRH